MKRQVLSAAAVLCVVTALAAVRSVRAEALPDHVVIDPQRVGPSRGIDGVIHPLSFAGYEGELGVWQGELPFVGTPIRLLLHPAGAGILVVEDGQGVRASSSITIEAASALGRPGAVQTGPVTMRSVAAAIVFLGKSSREERMFGVTINGKIVEILFVDPHTGRVVRRIAV